MMRAALLVNVALLVTAQGPTFDEYKSAKANATTKADEEAADQAKMAAVGKVATMLEEVQAKVLAEGEAEAQTYNKFACFCKDTIAEKSEAIKSGEDEKKELEASIDELSVKRDGLDTRIEELEDTIEEASENVTKAKEVRASELALFKANVADLDAGIVALDGAIKSLKASKNPAAAAKEDTALVQLSSDAKEGIRKAALMADAYGLVGDSEKKAMAFLQQAPEVEFEDYKFHSNDIIATLEKLRKDFQAMKEEVDAEEVKSVQAHNVYLQDMDAKIKALQLDVKEAQAEKAETIATIKSESEQLITVSAELLDNKQYLEKLAEMCQDKKKTWDQRTRLRADELTTLTEVIGIIKGAVKGNTTSATVRFNQVGVSLRRSKAMATDRKMMDVLEMEAEEADAAPAFVQQRSVHKHQPADKDGGRKYVAAMLQKRGQELKSQALVSLARELFVVDGQDPFSKVKQLIQELIERLLQEAANEANQKGWCDKATSAAEQKKTYAVEEIRALNADMAELEALRDKLAEELAVLADEIAELKKARQDAEALRAKEKAENEATIAEADAGLSAIKEAMTILDRFYKTAAKETVSLSQQTPEEDAPDAGFENFEAYKGAQAESGGILGMMEVIESDFTRTITETEKAEQEAEEEHLEFMTETGKSLGEKQMIEKQKTTEKDNAEDSLGQADDKLQSNTKTLQAAITELIELKAACIDTGMTYEERVARREQEIEALKKALCILGAYQEYGPDGLADAC